MSDHGQIWAWYYGCGLKGIYYHPHCADSATKPSNQYSSFSGTHMWKEGRSFSPPFGLCCLDCSQYIYLDTIKVIHPHRKSRPFENGVNIKLSFHPSSFFIGTEPRRVETSLNFSIFCRYMKFLDYPRHPNIFRNNHHARLNKTSVKDLLPAIMLLCICTSSYPFSTPVAEFIHHGFGWHCSSLAF